MMLAGHGVESGGWNGAKRNAAEIHAQFAGLEGSRAIASLNAVKGVMRLVRRVRPDVVLEIGPGIGTLTYAVLAADPNVRVITVEGDAWCRSVLPNNLKPFSGRFEINASIEEVAAARVRLLIIDGGANDARYFSSLDDDGWMFVEGDRSSQRALFEQAIGRPFAGTIRDDFRNKVAGGIKASYHVYRLSPSVGIRSRFYFLRWWDRLGTKIARIVRH